MTDDRYARRNTCQNCGPPRVDHTGGPPAVKEVQAAATGESSGWYVVPSTACAHPGCAARCPGFVEPHMSVAEGQAAYRAAWTARCLGRTSEELRLAEQAMDAVQPFCTSDGRPGPEWEDFIDALPGYREHWEDLRRAANAMGRERFGELWKGI